MQKAFGDGEFDSSFPVSGYISGPNLYGTLLKSYRQPLTSFSKSAMPKNVPTIRKKG
jgi:hypothetical protein